MSTARALRRTTPSRDAQVYMSEDAFAMKRHLGDAIEIYDNGYDDIRASAIEAIASGRAAYWTVSKYHNSRAIDLPLALNPGMSIRTALENAYPGWRADQRPSALETIVPLNRKAAIALSGAYASYGIWREEEELEMRVVRDCRKVGA